LTSTGRWRRPSSSRTRIKKQLDSYIYEHLNIKPASIRQEPTVYVNEYEKLVNESVVDRVNAENKEEPTAMKAHVLAKASQDVPVIKQE
jgi:hypothetical protein